jgi:hypothetical protein
MISHPAGALADNEAVHLFLRRCDLRIVAAGTIPPVVGLGGEHTAVPMATLVIVCAAASLFGLLLVLAKPGRCHRGYRAE